MRGNTNNSITKPRGMTELFHEHKGRMHDSMTSPSRSDKVNDSLSPPRWMELIPWRIGLRSYTSGNKIYICEDKSHGVWVYYTDGKPGVGSTIASLRIRVMTLFSSSWFHTGLHLLNSPYPISFSTLSCPSNSNIFSHGINTALC